MSADVPPLSVKAVLFDLDGTLLDTVPDLHVAVCAMLRDCGRPELSLDATRRYVGRGAGNLVKRALAGSLAAADDPAPPPAAALESFRQHYRRENGHAAQIYPGVIDGLDAFKAMDLPLAVVTNKPDAFVQPLLEMTGLAKYFALAIGGGRLPKLKPDPMPLVWVCGRLNVSPVDMLFIGDSLIDFQAARAAGSKIFLLPYGYNEGRRVQELDCDAIVPSIADAAAHLCRRPG